MVSPRKPQARSRRKASSLGASLSSLRRCSNLFFFRLVIPYGLSNDLMSPDEPVQ